MGTMRIDRLGVDATITDPAAWRATGGIHTIRGWLTNSTPADRQSLRRELISLAREQVTTRITYTGDSTFDGYFRIHDADVEADVSDRPLATGGRIPFAIDAELRGDHSTVEHLSNYSGLLVANDHGLATGEVTYWHAPPVAGDEAYYAGGGTSATSRTTEDGSIPVFLNIPLTDSIGSARWGCSPANYFAGAARVDVDGYTRVGRLAPMTPASFVLGNGLIEMRAEASAGATIGDIGIRCYNGSWGSWTPFDVVWNSTTDIPEWHFFNIIYNRAEMVIVQLVRDANEAPPTDNRHWLTFTIRRGAPYVSCYYTYSSAVALTIDRATTDAGSSVTPTGASSAMAVQDSANDADGNRWVVGAEKTITADTVNGGIDLASSTSHGFFLGFVIGGTSADTDNNADAICRQYLASLTESVQATIR